MPQQLLINIGNTHVQAGVQRGQDIVLLGRWDTDEIRQTGRLPLLDDANQDWIGRAVSVVPPVQAALSERYGKRLYFLTRQDFAGLDFSLVDSSTMGMDRIANAWAAYSAFGKGVVVLDCGTCLNTMVVNDKGQVLGGAILPGRMMLRRSLNAFTAQLPVLPIRNQCPAPIGANTLDAMAAGVDLGVLGSVREILARTRQTVPDCAILATGGDAPYFLANLPELTPAPDYLTLRGTVCQAPLH